MCQSAGRIHGYKWKKHKNILNNKRNTLDCEFVTKLMHTPRAIFSRLFLQICLSVLSLHTLRRLVTLSCEIVSYASAVIIESEAKVWSVYVHKVNRIMRFRDVAVWIYKMATWSNRKWRRSIRRPRKPCPRTKHEGERITLHSIVWMKRCKRWTVEHLNLTR